jgi:sialic acid synthase SpsE
MSLKDLQAPYVIADVGSNWKTSNDSTDNFIMAQRHIHDAAKAGVSAVKFQYFTDEDLYGMPGPNKWTLPPEWLPELAAYAAKNGVDFMCTAFSPKGYGIVDPFVNVHKVASSEMEDIGILNRLIALEKPFLISTGGACTAEVQRVAAYLTEHELRANCDFAFLECVAAYPAKIADYNLRFLDWRCWLGYSEHECAYSPVKGISDHTLSNVVALTSVGLGATVFEKHYAAFDLTSTPDKCVSIGTQELCRYVGEIKDAFSALGDGHKIARPSEYDMTLRHRRRLKVIAPVAQGETLKVGVNFGSFRSLTLDPEAEAPHALFAYDGKKAKRNLSPGDSISAHTVEL